MPNTAKKEVSMLDGFIVKGNQIGRTIGFPTANLDIQSISFPSLNGVYSVYVYYKNQKLMGIMNVGFRPTFKQQKPKKTFEVYIFNFNQEIYGEKIQVEIVGFIRNEQKFNSIKALTNQLKMDCQEARKHFENPKLKFSNVKMHIQLSVIHLPDLEFARYCADKYGVNRGIYNTIDKWFSEKGYNDIVKRRRKILYFLEWVTAYITDDLKLKFGNKGLSEQMERYLNESTL